MHLLAAIHPRHRDMIGAGLAETAGGFVAHIKIPGRDEGVRPGRTRDTGHLPPPETSYRTPIPIIQIIVMDIEEGGGVLEGGVIDLERTDTSRYNGVESKHWRGRERTSIRVQGH